MQQEQLDNELVKTGDVPVTDAVHKMPAAANGPSKIHPTCDSVPQRRKANGYPVKGPAIEEDDEEAEFRKLQAEMAM
jgi:charged multivesicular body protein 4